MMICASLYNIKPPEVSSDAYYTMPGFSCKGTLIAAWNAANVLFSIFIHRILRVMFYDYDQPLHDCEKRRGCSCALSGEREGDCRWNHNRRYRVDRRNDGHRKEIYKELGIQLQDVSYPEKIKANLVAQLTSSVRWTQIMQNMIKDGATSFLEIGPGNVLQGLLKKIDRSLETAGIQ